MTCTNCGDWLELLKATSASLVVVSILVVYWGIRQQHQWNRRQQTYALIKDINSYLTEHRGRLLRAFPELDGPNIPVPLSQQDAADLFQAGRDPTRKKKSRFSQEMRSVAHDHLNYLDMVAVAYLSQITDRKVVKYVMYDFLRRDYRFFRTYIEYIQSTSPTSYKPLVDAVNKMGPKIENLTRWRTG